MQLTLSTFSCTLNYHKANMMGSRSLCLLMDATKFKVKKARLLYTDNATMSITLFYFELWKVGCF